MEQSANLSIHWGQTPLSDIAFRIMMTRWRLNPADLVYVGDNLVKDFQAPLQLGMRSIWFKNADGIYQDINKDSGWTARTISELKVALLHEE